MYRLLIIFLLNLTPTAFSFSIYSDYNLSHLSREERYAWYDCTAGDLKSDQCFALTNQVCEANTNKFSQFCVDQYFKRCSKTEFEGDFCQEKLELACSIDLNWSKKCESFRYDQCKTANFEGNLRIRNPLRETETVKSCPQIRVETFLNLLSDEVTRLEKKPLGDSLVKDRRYDSIVDEGFWELAKPDLTSPFADNGKELCLLARKYPDSPNNQVNTEKCDLLCGQYKSNLGDPLFKNYEIFCPEYVEPASEIREFCGEISETIGDAPTLMQVLSVRNFLKKKKADVKCYDFLYKKAAKDGVVGAPGSWDQIVAMDIYLRDKVGRNGRDLKSGLTRFLARYGADDHTTLFFLLSDYTKADRETKIAILDRLKTMTTPSGVATLLLYQQLYGGDKDYRAKAMEAFANRWRFEFDYSYVADVGTEVSSVLLPCTSAIKAADVETFQKNPDIRALAQVNLEDQFCKLGIGLNLRDQIKAIYDEIYFPSLEGAFGKEAQLAALKSIHLLTNAEDRPRLLSTLDRLAASNVNFDIKTAIISLLIVLKERERVVDVLDRDLRKTLNAGVEDTERLNTLLTLLAQTPAAFSLRSQGVSSWSFTKGTYFDYLILCAQNGNLSERFKNSCFDQGIDIAIANAPLSSLATDRFFDLYFYQLAGERITRGKFVEKESTLKRVLDHMNFTRAQDAQSAMIKAYFADIGYENLKTIFASRFETNPFLLEDFDRLARLTTDSTKKAELLIRRAENKALVSAYLERSWGTIDFKALLESPVDLIKKTVIRTEIAGEPFATSYYRFIPETVFGNWTPDTPWKLESVLTQGFVNCENDPNRTWPDFCARIPLNSVERPGQIKWESIKRSVVEHIFKSDRSEIKKYGLFTKLLSTYRLQQGFAGNDPKINPYSLSWGIYGSSDTTYSFTRPVARPIQQ